MISLCSVYVRKGVGKSPECGKHYLDGCVCFSFNDAFCTIVTYVNMYVNQVNNLLKKTDTSLTKS